MVSPAVPGQVPHPSIVPEFLRSTSCKMTSARGHGAIVYCLNSGSEDRQTGRHNGKRKKTEEREERRRRKKKRTKKERGRVEDGKREEKESGERERGARLGMEKRAESGDWSEKDDERRWR
ncbi:hypothetical protein TNCV_3243391 [Trichonephila clavipes]|nr:hypothetical protein TNCV_3243391 [Trichonephila clavipes]